MTVFRAGRPLSDSPPPGIAGTKCCLCIRLLAMFCSAMFESLSLLAVQISNPLRQQLRGLLP